MNTKSLVAGVVIGAVIFGGGGYYFGSKKVADVAQGARQFAGAQGGARGPGGARGGGFVGGEIIAKDDKSITVKTQNGSTKIVLMASSSQVTKAAPGSSADLSNGTNVIVTGTSNADGSVTAQTVQIRPAGALPVGGPRTQ